MTAATVSNLLEIIMLICFGCSWPLNAVKNYKLKSAKPMNLPFFLLIEFGYVAGIIAKLLKSDHSGLWPLVMAVYLLNFVTVGANIVIYFINKGYDRKNGIK